MILQDTVPFDISNPKPLPGIAPMDLSEWFLTDEAHDAQLQERARLIDTQYQDVVAMTEGSEPACQELWQIAQDSLRARGERVSLTDRGEPLKSLGKAVQEDFCILEKRDDEHVMTAAVLCFPASWLLSEKIGRPLTHIHGAVQDYDPNVARRVQRLFDGIQVGRPLWRWNALWNDDPALFQPRSVIDPRPPADPDHAPFLRCERQCLVRLPQTRAVVFSIHTFVLARKDALRQLSN